MAENIILYTIGCPQCKMLEMLLQKREIHFEVCTDQDRMREIGIKSAPVLSVNGELLMAKDAFQWVRSRED